MNTVQQTATLNSSQLNAIGAAKIASQAARQAKDAAATAVGANSDLQKAYDQIMAANDTAVANVDAVIKARDATEMWATASETQYNTVVTLTPEVAQDAVKAEGAKNTAVASSTSATSSASDSLAHSERARVYADLAGQAKVDVETIAGSIGVDAQGNLGVANNLTVEGITTTKQVLNAIGGISGLPSPSNKTDIPRLSDCLTNPMFWTPWMIDSVSIDDAKNRLLGDAVFMKSSGAPDTVDLSIIGGVPSLYINFGEGPPVFGGVYIPIAGGGHAGYYGSPRKVAISTSGYGNTSVPLDDDEPQDTEADFYMHYKLRDDKRGIDFCIKSPKESIRKSVDLGPSGDYRVASFLGVFIHATNPHIGAVKVYLIYNAGGMHVALLGTIQAKLLNTDSNGFRSLKIRIRSSGTGGNHGYVFGRCAGCCRFMADYVQDLLITQLRPYTDVTTQ